jgi:hypothetical protein
MSYEYVIERPKLFTEDGQMMFLKIRDAAHRLLSEAGAFRQQEVPRGVTGESWMMQACLDLLVELKEIVELKRDSWMQYRVYTTPQVHNL